MEKNDRKMFPSSFPITLHPLQFCFSFAFHFLSSFFSNPPVASIFPLNGIFLFLLWSTWDPCKTNKKKDAWLKEVKRIILEKLGCHFSREESVRVLKEHFEATVLRKQSVFWRGIWGCCLEKSIHVSERILRLLF